MPNSREWLSVFSEALSQTIYAHNYEQVDDTDLTPEQAAQEAYTRYVAWLGAVCGDTCPPATIIAADGEPKRIYRRNPTTGQIEQLEADGETWTPPSGDDAIPPPEARTEDTEDERLCAAASNAANVIKELYAQVDADINAEVDSDQMQINIATYVSGVLAAALLNPTLGSIAAALGAFNAFVEIGQQIVLVNLWNNSFHDAYVCALLENASEVGGVVTFDYWAVNQALLGQSFSGQYIYLIMQVLYLHSIIGADGLNLAGATTAVEGDCPCGEWCRTFDFTASPQDWSTFILGTFITTAGTWVSGVGWQGTIAVDSVNARGVNIVVRVAGSGSINRVEVVYSRSNGQYTSTIPASQIALDWNGSTWTVLQQVSSPGATGTNISQIWSGADTDFGSNVVVRMSASVRAAANPSPLGSVTISRIILSGTGPNPFGENNCE